MKILKYQLLLSAVDHGTENRSDLENILLPKERYSDDENFERNYAIAQAEAYNGEITVEDVPDPVTEPTQEERNRADIDYLAVMMGVEL